MGQGRGKAPRDPAQVWGHLDSCPAIQLSCGVTLTSLLPLWAHFFSAEGEAQLSPGDIPAGGCPRREVQ